MLRSFGTSVFTRAYSTNRILVMENLGKIREQVLNGKGCLSDQLGCVNVFLAAGNSVTSSDSALLMQACAGDIIDVKYIKEQQRITTSTWNNIINNVDMQRTVKLYNSALEAFMFQEIEINEGKFMRDLQSHCKPDINTYENLISLNCRRRNIKKALELTEAHNLWNEDVSADLITAHVSLHKIKEAEEIMEVNGIEEFMLALPHHERNNLPVRLKMAGAFLTGAAASGDMDRLQYYLEKYTHGIKELLVALIELCRVSPENYKIILDRIPGKHCKQGHLMALSKQIRRPAKQLLYLNLDHAAVELVSKSIEIRDIKAFHSMRIRTPVMLLEHYLDNVDIVEEVWRVMELLEKSDPDIKAKCISLLYLILHSSPQRKSFCHELTQRIDANFHGLHNTVAFVFMNKVVKDLADKAESDRDLVKLIKTSSDLGIRVDHVPLWNIILHKLIPNSKTGERMNQKQLISRIFEVRNLLGELVKKEKGFYSHSIVWGHIMETLLHRNSDVFFTTAALICKRLGVAYAPTRWYVHLGKSLYSTKLLSPYVDIIKVAYSSYVKNPARKKDFIVVTDSMLVAIERAKEDGMNIDDLIADIFTLSWNRGVLFPRSMKEAVCGAVESRSIADQILLIPSLEDSEEGLGKDQ